MDITESNTENPKNILVISYGPVPTPEFQKIEGGGMRCWGLALGLRDNGHNVTVSVFNEFKQGLSSHDGIGLHNWTLDDDFKAYMNSFDVVIVSYSMGDLSVFVADNLSHYVTLVLDCYVPIFIEISARDSDDKAGELRGYLDEVERFNHVLKRGDFFICANEPQKHMYMGILGSLGVINPHSYRQNRVLLVPFGVEKNAISKGSKVKNPYNVSSNKNFVLLWFGGLYPWFNFEPLINAVEGLSKKPNFKFFLVGGKNPYNNHPDFVKQYDRVLAEFTKLGLVGKSVFFIDWIDFDDRERWYKNADLVVSINNPGEENVYSWRTRIMDYLWGELPIITNGGDPLSDELIAGGGAVQVGLSSAEIMEKISSLMSNRAALDKMRKRLGAIKNTYHWQKVTRALSEKISSDDNLPFVESLTFTEEHKINRPSTRKLGSRKAIHVAKKLKSYSARARQKGLKRSARFAASIIKAQAKSTLQPKRDTNSPKAVFLSHPIDHTGAPLVLLDIINDFGEEFKHNDIHIVAPAIEKSLLNPLLQEKYKIHKMAEGIGGRIIQAGLQIAPNDFVLMNTTAPYANYKIYFYWMLESGRLNRAFWFIHEDNPYLRFDNKKEVSRIKALVSSGKLKILVPSIQTAKEYNAFFETNSVKPIRLRVTVPDKYCHDFAEKDFETIRFFMSGIPLDGRKGQLFFLSALQLFEAKYKAAAPEQYRPYTLDLVAIGKDYISEQIISIGQTILGDRLHIHPIVEKTTALEISSNCNVTVCTSLNETFGLFVAEGMLMGHPILRNDTSGWQEQIKDGKNGFMFETLSLEQLAEQISKLLSKKLTNRALVGMSKESRKIARPFASANYYDQIIGQ